MNKIEIAKKALEITISFGASKVTHDIIKNNVVTDTTFQKVTVGVASFAIGSAVAAAAHKQLNADIDGVIDAFKNTDHKLHVVQN